MTPREVAIGSTHRRDGSELRFSLSERDGEAFVRVSAWILSPDWNRASPPKVMVPTGEEIALPLREWLRVSDILTRACALPPIRREEASPLLAARGTVRR